MDVRARRRETEAEQIRRRLADQVKLLLHKHQMSRQELSDHLGLDRSTLSKALDDTRPRDFRGAEISAMAVLFNVPIDFLFGVAVEEEWAEQLHRAEERARQRQGRP